MKNLCILGFIILFFTCDPVNADWHYSGGLSIGLGETEDIQTFNDLSVYVGHVSGERMRDLSIKFFVTNNLYRMGLFLNQRKYGIAFPEEGQHACDIDFNVTSGGVFISRSIYYKGNFSIFTGCKFGLGRGEIEYDGNGYKGKEYSNTFLIEPLLNFQHSLLHDRFIFGYELSVPCLSFYEDFSFTIDDNEFSIERDIIGLLLTLNVNYYHK